MMNSFESMGLVAVIFGVLVLLLVLLGIASLVKYLKS